MHTTLAHEHGLDGQANEQCGNVCISDDSINAADSTPETFESDKDKFAGPLANGVLDAQSLSNSPNS